MKKNAIIFTANKKWLEFNLKVSLLIVSIVIISISSIFSQHDGPLDFRGQELLNETDRRYIITGAIRNADELNVLVQMAMRTAAIYNINSNHPHHRLFLQAIAVGIRDRSIAMEGTFFRPTYEGSAFRKSLHNHARSYVSLMTRRPQSNFPSRRETGTMTRRGGNNPDSDEWQISRLGHRLGMELSNHFLLQPANTNAPNNSNNPTSITASMLPESRTPTAIPIGYPPLSLMTPAHFEHQLIHLISLPSDERNLRMTLDRFREMEIFYAAELERRRIFFNDRRRTQAPTGREGILPDPIHWFNPQISSGGG